MLPRGSLSASEPDADPGGHGADEPFDFARPHTEPVIRLCSGSRQCRLDNIKAIHVGGFAFDLASTSISTRVAKIARTTGEKIRFDRKDSIRLLEIVCGISRLAERQHCAEVHV